MTLIRLTLLSALLLPLSAMASSFAGTTAGTSAGSASDASSGSSNSSSGGDDKVVLDARADAAVFVASDGAIRGAQLQAALVQLREQDAQARQASDLELAQGILAR